MEDINTVVKQADRDVIELMCLIYMQKQTNKEKYEIIKPFFERLNLYCDEYSLRFDKDADLFSIPLNSIDGVDYEEEDDVLFMLFNKNKTLHAFSLPEHLHTIYVYKKKRNCIVELILRTYNRIGNIIMIYRLKRKLIKYIKKQLFITKH